MRVTVDLSELEAEALVETVNRAWDNIPTARVKLATGRATDKIEAAIRAYRRRQREAA